MADTKNPGGGVASPGGLDAPTIPISEHTGAMDRLGQEGAEKDLPHRGPAGARPSTPDNVAPSRDERFGEAAKK